MKDLRLAHAIAAGVALGALVTLSPLMMVATALAAIIVASVRQNLGENERRTVTAIVLAAIIIRVVVVVVLSFWNIPHTSAQSGGLLRGDEAYLFERSLRTRDLLVGFPVGKLDYMMVFDEYADTKYIWWLSWVQTTFGPSPFSIRVVNGLLFVAGACVLYRLARHGFGYLAAQCGLAAVLFLPSLVFGSISLLKDSIFFLLTTGAIAAAIPVARSPSRRLQIVAMALLLAMLWGLADLRPGAIALTGGGIALGFAIRAALKSKVGMATAIAGVVLACAATAMSTSLSSSVRGRLTWLAQQHIGHATTPGHAYRTLDDRFYTDWYGTLGGQPMQPAAATRYVARSAVAFVVIPLPWHAVTTSELAFIPEQLVWYLIAAFGVAGLGAAYRRDPLLTSLLLGYILAMSAALALTNGNVGTLVRLRGLVSRFAVWIAAVGLMVAIKKIAGDRVSA